MALWKVKDRLLSGLSANRKFSSDALYQEVLYEVCELKTSVFRRLNCPL